MLVRWTVVSALKYAMIGKAPHAVLCKHMDFFLVLLKDEDLSVRHASLQMCNAAVHHQRGLISQYLNTLIQPVLFETVTFKSERVVDLGPFKQKVDDGLPLRKVCLATINTILDSMPEQLDVAALIEPLKAGLADQQDVQVLCHQIVVKLLGNRFLLVKGSILSHVEGLVLPLKSLIDKTLKTISKKLKEGSGGTEIERLNDLMRSCLRAFLAFESCKSIEESLSASKTFGVMRDLVRSNERVQALVDAIEAEG
jgi:cullin-associated NEDD8-dissociated protein 1